MSFRKFGHGEVTTVEANDELVKQAQQQDREDLEELKNESLQD